MATLTLTLGTDPSPDPLNLKEGEAIAIVNNLGAEVVINITGSNGFLNPSPQNQITVPTAGWNGHAGTTDGEATYEYSEPTTKRAMRNGTINISK
jgi:hypothetical protein